MSFEIRYRKRPVTVAAEQWFPGKPIRGVKQRTLLGHDRPLGWIECLEGPRIVNAGDWVVKDNDGELSVVPDRKFRDIYEQVDSASEHQEAL